MKIFNPLWRDSYGSVAPATFVLLATIVALGVVVGVTTLRDQIVQELGDIAVALDSIDQSFTTSAYTINGMVFSGSTFTDVSTLTDPAGSAPAGLDLGIAPSPES